MALVTHLLAGFDRSVLLFFNQFAGRSATLDNMAAMFADTYILSGILLMGMVAYCWFRRLGPEYVLERQYVLQEVLGALLAGVLSRGMQLLCKFHPRPLHDASLHFHPPIGLDPNTLNHRSSFPSDHAAVFFALALVITLHSRRLGMAAWIWAAVALVPRIYLGFHWPSDIVAGALVGIGCVLACRLLIPRKLMTFLTDYEQKSPALFYCCAFVLCYQLGTLFQDVRLIMHMLRYNSLA
jgi:undecaprenyl-diphosphatase